MAKILELYEGDKKIKEQPENTEGKTTITIEGLDSDTDYPKGTYKVAWSENGKVSKKADVPEFKTKPIAVTGVTLDKTTLSLEEDATGNLVATVAPSTATDKTVTFTSSDAAIATVDNKGKVTAVKAGNADITVTTKDGSKTAKCELTVTAKTIAVTGVTIEPKTASVDVDATTKLNSTVAPSTATNKSVSYTSSDETVATVSSDGTVTGVAEGEATITVTTQDGNKSDTATVTVNAAVINVTGVAIEPETATLEIGETQQLTPTVEPSNASYKAVSFTSSDDTIATVDDDGLVTAVAEGSADITVESIADGSKTAVCTLTVNAVEEPEPEPEPEE